MKFISWNVNGLRAVDGKGFRDIFRTIDADFFCLQETKMQEGQLDIAFDGYESYWNYAEKKGYSGTAIFTKHKPLSVIFKTECRAMVGFILSDNETTNNITRPITIVNVLMMKMPSIVASVYLKKSFIRFCLNRFYLRMSSTGQWSEPMISLRILASTNRGLSRSDTRK